MGRWPASWPDRAWFLGIGGAAMSGLACLLAERGTEVAGSDGAVYPPASDVLAEAGIEVRTPFDAANVPTDGRLIVVGNAISRGNPELERALDLGLPLASMAELIERLLVPGRRVIAVAGTHGKTTTASLVVHLLAAAGRDPSFVIGGRPGGFPRGAHLGRGVDLVVEADEYDTAFFDKGPKMMHYWPRIAVLGPVEFDHADIYADQAAVERAFALFLRLVPAAGRIVAHADDPVARRLAGAASAPVTLAGDAPDAAFSAAVRDEDAGGQTFDLLVSGRAEAQVRCALPGAHNRHNVLAALAAVDAAGLPAGQAARHVATFRPPARRLTLIAAGARGTAWDDFAHHPTAIRATLETVRRAVPEGGRLVACVEPRSNTMVRAGTAPALFEALRAADVVYLGPVDRPERFTDDERLDVAALAARLRAEGIDAEGPLEAGEIAARIAAGGRAGDRIVVMSNGAFGGLPQRLAEVLR
ncbi:MAG: UDP-N-acetylmuramate:L-alanyl-gamma-D-glutamyl-me so-diaminopimelate ligase [Acidobacteriota bacterium]